MGPSVSGNKGRRNDTLAPSPGDWTGTPCAPREGKAGGSRDGMGRSTKEAEATTPEQARACQAVGQASRQSAVALKVSVHRM